MKLIIIVACFCYRCESDIHKGPSYSKRASDCLDDILRNHFVPEINRTNSNDMFLLTFIVTDDLTSPANEIQEDIIARANTASGRILMEIASLGERYQFASYSVCYREKQCRHHFVVNYKSSIFVIVMDEVSDFEEMLDIINGLVTFNPSAMFLVYLEQDDIDSEGIAGNLLWNLWENLISTAAVLMPLDSHSFNLYKLDFDVEGPEDCGSQKHVILIDQCRDGEMQHQNEFYFAANDRTDYLGCSLRVIAKPYGPFVVNEDEGFEIQLLETFGETLNIHMNITLTDFVRDSFGSRVNGSFTGGLKLVYEQLAIAVGNIQTGRSDYPDFVFSKVYHMEPLVLIVPRAQLVPRWRIFVAIFTMQMWSVCIGSVVVFALLFLCTNKYPKGSKDRPIEYPLLTAFQIIIGQAVHKHPGPGKEMQRVFFVSLNIFSIILYSVYTCSLVYYLKNPMREYQIYDQRDLLDQFGNLRYDVGGIRKYKEAFFGETSISRVLFENYQTISEENETVAYWVEIVGGRDDFVTLASQFYVSYLIANDDRRTTYPDGQPKVYVSTKPLLTYGVSLMVRKGHPLLDELDDFITKVTTAGLVDYWCQKYIRRIGMGDASDDESDDNPFESLTTEHLQGAFTILAFGYVFGLFTFLLENIYKKILDWKKERLLIDYKP